VTWTVTITDGIYTFICDAHPTQMKGAFAAGTAQLPPPPPPPPPPPSVKKLSGKVTARTISLKSGSGKVKTLTAGRFKLPVSATRRAQTSHPKGRGGNKKPAAPARSKAPGTLTLKPGKYTYRSDTSRKLRGSFTVKAR